MAFICRGTKIPRDLRVEDGHALAPSEPQQFFELELREVFDGQQGVFTHEPISAGAVVFIDGGIILHAPDQLQERYLNYQAMIGPDRYISPPDLENLHPIFFLNHSCQSNLARHGGLVYSARRCIVPGEQLTVDYSAFIAETRFWWTLDCACGAPNCRKTITPDDWRAPAIARMLWPEFLPFVQRRYIDTYGRSPVGAP